MEVKLLTCKNCGEPLELSLVKNNIIKCKYCSTEHVLPNDDTPEEAKLYLHDGQRALDVGNFDEALTCFDKTLEIEPIEPEGYFGKFLAKHKVQYLKDIVNNRLQPIVHELIDKDILEDNDYKKAIRFANVDQKEIYQKRVEEIDHIKKSFMELDKSNLDYDSFICVKVTDDETKSRTKDSRTAEKIYDILRRKGYRPFYSEIEIKGRTGSDYEAMILYALMKSECMLVVCSNEEYLNTKWVKNEYTRFLKLVNDEVKASDAITIIFDGKPIEKLPGKKGKIQGINLDDLDAIETIEKYVYNHTPRAKKEKEAKERAKQEKENALKLEQEQKRLKESEELKKQLAEQAELIKKLQEQSKTKESSSNSLSESSILELIERVQREKELKNKQESNAEEKQKSEELEIKRKTEKEKQDKKDGEIKDGFVFDLVDKNKIIKYIGKSEKVVIPNFVTSIGDFAFKNCKSLETIVIPDSVTSIGKNAFEGCYSILSIEIPSKVNKVEDSLFYGCTSLASVILSNSVTSIGNKAFFACDSLASINIPNSVTKIGESAFSSCKSLKSIEIPSSVASIGVWAFSGCSSLTIYCEVSSKPDEWDKNWNVERRMVYWSYKSSFEKKQFEKESKEKPLDVQEEKRNAAIKNGFVFDNEDKNKLIKYKGISNKIEIPDFVTSIESRTFEDCKSLTSIIIPSSVTTIGNSAFMNCTSLTSINIPDSVTSIGNFAFCWCNSLTSIVIPGSVTKIGKSSFVNCHSLTSITIQNGVTSIENEAFCFCTSLTSIEIPSSVTSIGWNAFSHCDSLTSITIPNSVTRIEKDAFNFCNKLINIKCEANKMPLSWDKEWNNKDWTKKGLFAPRHKVIWGYKK